MKPIKKVSVAPIDPITGSIVDGTNIDDKATNTYSANTIDGLVKETYSTTEQFIGYWIDGKPIYRKVIGFISGTNNIESGITNMDTLVDLRGATTGQPINFYLVFGGNEYFVSTQFDRSNNQLIHFCSDDYANKQTYAIVEYTKTTD